MSVKENKNKKGLKIFNQTFLYTAYADDTTATFFLKDKESLIEVMRAFDTFSSFSDLKPNKSKCEWAGISALKGDKLAFCSMKYTDLRLNTVKILGINFLYNKKTEIDENFLKQIANIERVLNLRQMPNLILEEKITVFKALAMSKIVHLALITNI